MTLAKKPTSRRGGAVTAPAGDDQFDELNAALTATARQVRRQSLFALLGTMAKVPIRPHLLLLFAKIAELEPVRVIELAVALEVDRSTISRQVGELVAGGLVVRLPDPSDGRSHFVVLSRKGTAAQASILGAWRSVLSGATAQWTADERRTLSTLLDRLAVAIERITTQLS
jgi:DNA-binding MarR family transcriptional regulator